MRLVEQPRLLLVAGPNVAGKTTVTERGLAHEWFAGCEYVNPDFIACYALMVMLA
jgi:predicted ABC-type ATPase